MNEMVYVLDDDEAVRDSLRWLLEGHGFGHQLRICRPLPRTVPRWPDTARACLILDVRMPGMTGPNYRKSSCDAKSICHHLHYRSCTVPMAVDSMKKGAVDFLEKPFSDELLCARVANAFETLRGESEKLDACKRAADLIARLTPREAQVLDRIVAGRLNKQIADDLNISIKTVEAHRANIMDKIEARTMADLMKTALAAKSA